MNIIIENKNNNILNVLIMELTTYRPIQVFFNHYKWLIFFTGLKKTNTFIYVLSILVFNFFKLISHGLKWV